jgi:hypothetical protein
MNQIRTAGFEPACPKLLPSLTHIHAPASGLSRLYSNTIAQGNGLVFAPRCARIFQFKTHVDK